jgi:hypothetical protein
MTRGAENWKPRARHTLRAHKVQFRLSTRAAPGPRRAATIAPTDPWMCPACGSEIPADEVVLHHCHQDYEP